MKLISIKKELTIKFHAIDEEVLLKDKRPAVLVVRLRYKGADFDFAIPLRSNIAPSTPKDEYFALPNRKTTKEKHHHGLHYTKMFPVDKKFFERYRIEGDIASKLCLAIIDKHEKQIVNECQAYLSNFEAGRKPLFSTDIDALTEELKRLCGK